MNAVTQSCGAGEALANSVMKEVNAIPGLNRAYGGPPLQAAFPFALVEAESEADWSHKSGQGREVRLSITIRDRGERPARTGALLGKVEAAVMRVESAAGEWRIVTLQFLRSRTFSIRDGEWAGTVLYRARMLRLEEEG